ncbi:GntR family transcriptional regulator [Rhizobiaceae bacterium BDR2-2]|uniref:GntR family transcriptional regulator n=1 Tax=Ectorhizobium quercum TaxID=2965071 RepID=A0AAE3SYD0_9HYPH|nr:GntR family transcriptional regulator [Ectorhizobium quercum]MCX8999415.1 GntR family transcriptional regulator [Ectorhizobium quercum]
MRADLLMGEFEHGQWLRLNELEKRYSVSRFEVRKALATLAAVGALEHVENHGYRLPPADPERDSHHREIRMLLELGAAPKVYYRASIDDLAHLHELARNFSDAVEGSSLIDIQTANDNFHRAFFALCGNPVLSGTIDELRELVRPYSRHPYSTSENRQQSAAEHFEMLDCIEQKNLPGLLDVMRRHLYRISIASKLAGPGSDDE